MDVGEANWRRVLRVIGHLDLDCFYAQVEQRRLGIPRHTPVAVQQWSSLIAVNYAARQYGLRRGQQVAEATKLCPAVQLVHVGVVGCEPSSSADPVPDRNQHKASLTRYRQASQEVLDVVSRHHASNFERVSIDEVYLDLSDDVVGLIYDAFKVLHDLQSAFAASTDGRAEPCEGRNNVCVVKAQCPDAADEHPQCPFWDPLPSLEEATVVIRDTRSVSYKGLEWTAKWLQWLDTRYDGFTVVAGAEEKVLLESIFPLLLQMGSALFDRNTGLLNLIAQSYPHKEKVLRRVATKDKDSSLSLGTVLPKDIPLLFGALFVYRTREAIERDTHFTVSVGIARTKFLAKEISARYKPDAQTILLDADVSDMLKLIPLTQARNLRGKTGHLVGSALPDVQSLYHVSEKYTLPQLKHIFRAKGLDDQFAEWLFRLATGQLDEPVRSVTRVKSMMACKTFYETRTMEGLKHWVKLVCVDLAERLVSEYRTRRRIPKSFAVHQTGGSPNAARTRSVPPFVLNLQDETATRERLIQRMMDALSSRFVPTELFPCTRLGLGAQLGAAEDTCSIQRLFLSAGTNTNSASVSSGDFVRPDSTLREPGSSSSDIDCSDSKHLRPGSSHSLAQSKVCRKRKRFSSETLCRCQYDSVIIMPSSQ